MDSTYRSDLLELIDARFDQLDAKLEQLLGKFRAGRSGDMASLRAEFRTELARMETRLTLRMFLLSVGSVGMFFLQKL